MYRFMVVTSLFFLSSLCYGEEPVRRNLVMGFVPSRSVHEIQISSQKIADYLSKQTGYGIKAITLSNYAGVALAMKSKRVDFAFVGPVNYLLIDERAGAFPLTAAVRKGQKGYRGIIIVRTDSGIHSLADLKGKRFAFGDALSASASLYPKMALRKAGINPKVDIKSLMLSSQNAVVSSVLAGKVDAGAIYEDARLNPEVLKYYPDAMARTRVIYYTPLIPGDPQIVRASLNAGQRKKLAEALLAMAHDTRAKIWLKDIYGIDGLRAASADEYQDLRSVVEMVDPGLLASAK